MKPILHTKNGFTLVESLFVVAVMMIVLLVVIPNVTSKNAVVKDKGCETLIEVVNSQILMYDLDHGNLPDSINDLIDGTGKYLNEKQRTCPNGKEIFIEDGQAYAN